MRRTKIVATIGPASDSPEMIARLLTAGMDVARLNFSHGTHEYHAQLITRLRAMARTMDYPLTILQDLQGPKIRTGTLEGGKPVQLHPGDTLTLTTQDVAGNATRISTTYEALPRDVLPGDRILISDGLIELRVLDTSETEVHTTVVVGGELREKQGMNLPGVNVSAPSLTAKDIRDLEFGLEQDVDYIALSFVRRADDILEIKQRIANAGKHIPVIAKIEKPEALAELDAIIRLSDGVMVARGDLGVEIPTEQVPPAQKRIIEACNEVGIPVIIATQMLDSMIRNPRPTRAEASDVANAIFDSADAVMLSGETATGMYPTESVQMMANIIQAAEKSGRQRERVITPVLDIEPNGSIAQAISAAARAIVSAMPIHAIVALTLTGNTARLVSRQRPTVPILACTPRETTYRRMNLLWGVRPVMVPYTDRLVKISRYVYEVLVGQGFARPEDMIILIGGHPLATLGSTNFIKITRVDSLGTSEAEATLLP